MGKKLLEKAGLVGLPKMGAGAAVGAGLPERSRPAALQTAVPAGEPALPDTVPGVPPAVHASGMPEALRAKTAPGTMLGFMTAQSAAVQEAEQLRGRLQEFDGASPTRRIDPALVRPSVWANRHEASYLDAEFALLRADIASAGGNVQPIKVRPVAAAARGRAAGVGPSNPPALSPDGLAPQYEIVFGHRRHRACLELGLPVLAVVEPVSEQQLFVEMERENRARKDLSAWEQGAMYARALDQGLYPSNRQLALSIGRDLGDVGKALALARLPLAVVQAFASPLDLQFRWAKPLSDAQQQDPDALLARAQALKGRAETLNAREVFEALVRPAPARPAAAAAAALVPAAGPALSVDSRGRTTIRIDQVLSAERREALRQVLADFLAG